MFEMYHTTSKRIDRKDGTIVIENRCERTFDIEMPTVDNGRSLEVGDQGTLLIRETTDERVHSITMITDPRGVRGNSADEYAMHGWRGTFNDIAAYAYGWREVVSITPLKRGHGIRICFSVDTKLGG